MLISCLRSQSVVVEAWKDSASRNILYQEIVPNFDRIREETILLLPWLSWPLGQEEHLPIWKQNWKLGSIQAQVILLFPTISIPIDAVKAIWLLQLPRLHICNAQKQRINSQNHNVSQTSYSICLYFGSKFCWSQQRCFGWKAFLIERFYECW